MSRLRTIVDAMQDQVRGNGTIWGLIHISWLVLNRIRWKFIGWYLGADQLNLGSACHLNGVRFMRFGRDVSARSNLWIEAVIRYQGQAFDPLIVIGDRVRFSDAVHITAINRIEIGNDVLFGSGVFVSDHNHGSYAGATHSRPQEPPVSRALHSGGAVVIGPNVWIGDNVNIVGPVTIGSGAVIGANSVIRRDVQSCTLVGGAPARVIKRFDPETRQWVPAQEQAAARPGFSEGPGGRD